LPARVPRRPKVRIGPEIGTATRLVRTPITETWSKLVAMMGVVPIWAARLVVRAAQAIAQRFRQRWRGFATAASTLH
jgi:hypothetical protein